MLGGVPNVSTSQEPKEAQIPVHVKIPHSYQNVHHFGGTQILRKLRVVGDPTSPSADVSIQPPTGVAEFIGHIPVSASVIKAPLGNFTFAGFLPTLGFGTPSWPAELPQKQFIGLKDKRQSARHRTRMDYGPAKQRRRYTASVRYIKIPIVLTGAQRVIFDDFWINDLTNGTTEFIWEDPLDDTTQFTRYRFVGEPSWELFVGGAPDDRMWRATMDLEIRST